jgi:hypothetical protein
MRITQPGFFEDLIPTIRLASQRAGRPLQILADLQGPKFRTSEVTNAFPCLALESLMPFACVLEYHNAALKHYNTGHPSSHCGTMQVMSSSGMELVAGETVEIALQRSEDDLTGGVRRRITLVRTHEHVCPRSPIHTPRTTLLSSRARAMRCSISKSSAAPGCVDGSGE